MELMVVQISQKYIKRKTSKEILYHKVQEMRKNLSSHPRLEALYCFPKSISWINNFWLGASPIYLTHNFSTSLNRLLLRYTQNLMNVEKKVLAQLYFNDDLLNRNAFLVFLTKNTFVTKPVLLTLNTFRSED